MGKRKGFNLENSGTHPMNFNQKLTEMREKNAAAQAELKEKYLQQMRERQKQPE